MCMNQIIHGDVISVLKSLPSRLDFDVIIADPPYNIGKDFGNSKDKMPIEEYIQWSVDWISECRAKLAKNGIMYVYGFPEILARVSARFPLEEQQWLAWHYTNKKTPGSKFWQRTHESIMAIWGEGQPRPTLEIDQIRDPYSKAYKKALGKKRSGAKGRFSKSGQETIFQDHGGSLPMDILKFPALSGGAGSKERWFKCRDCDIVAPSKEKKNHEGHDIMQHETQKPQKLTERLMLGSISSEKQRVLIPFAGSGSECLAAAELGVQWLGIELNPEYIKFANEWRRQCLI